MLSEIFLKVADKVLSRVIDQLDPTEKLKAWLKLDPATLAFQKALARAYAAFARQHPEYAASLFDESFLSNDAVPEISKLLIRNQHPDPALLAQMWAKSIGFDAHSEFCKRATKPAADFLSWLSAELQVEQSFQALFDSRTLDSLPRIEAEIEKLTKELTRGLAAALKIACEYEKITLSIAGDVKDSNIIQGDGNQINVSNIYNHYYSGAFDTLHDNYVAPDAVFQRVRVDEFVGRDWLTAKVDAFLNDSKRKSGAFLLIGEAGVGKTSFMAHLVKERRYLHLFAEQVAGDANLQRALQSLGSQLVTHYQIDPYKDRDTLTQLSAFPDFLERLLRLAASTLTNGEKIIIVCDALDEAGTFPDGNVFGLPNVLPDGVYFILSQRPVNTKLPNFEPLNVKLEAQGEDNLQDLEAYLNAVIVRPEVAGQIRSKEYSTDFFIQTLKEKSLGVWVYLYYILKEIESGSRAPLDLANLPTGLVGYYADFWDDWRNGRKGRGEGARKWDELYLPLLTTLAAAQEAITVERLIQWSDVKATPREVIRLLGEAWCSFITEKMIGKNKTYSPYHLSLRDFITGKVDLDKLTPAQTNLVRDLAEQTIEAHERIINTFEEECKGEWGKLVQQEYPRLHLSAHFAGAKEYKKLANLLTEGGEHIQWAESRYKKEETYAGYLIDLTHILDYVVQKNNYALLIRCMLIENSIHSLASNISPALLAELGKTGLWNYSRCLTTIQQQSDSYQQAASMKLIISDIPLTLLKESFSVVSKIKDEYARADTLIALIPYLNDETNLLSLSAIQEIKDEDARVNVLTALAPYLNNKNKSTFLYIAGEIKNEYARARAFIAIVPHLNDKLKAQAIQDALTTTYDIKDVGNRINALTAIAIHLEGELKSLTLRDALSVTYEIKDEYARSSALTTLALYATNDFKSQVLSAASEIKNEYARDRVLTALVSRPMDDLKPQVLSAASEIKNEYARADTLSSLIPYRNNEPQALQNALVIAQNINDEDIRVSVLTALAPYLTDELKHQTLQDALVATRKINDENSRIDALIALVPHLIIDDLKNQALQDALSLSATRKIEDENVRVLTALSPYLTDELKHQALIMACEIKKEYTRALALIALVPHLTEELKYQALIVVLEIEKESTRTHALIALTPHLTEKLKYQVYFATQEIKDEYARVRVLTALAPHLTNAFKLQVLSTIQDIKDEYICARILIALTPYINDDLKSQVLSIARETREEYSRACILIALASYVNDDLKSQVLQEVLVIAHEINDDDPRASILAALAPHLINDLNLYALSVVREIKDEEVYARALNSFTPYLTENIRPQVLSAIGNIKDEHIRASVLTTLALSLNHESKTHFLSAVYEIKDEYARARVLIALAPRLNDDLKSQILQDALIATRKINDDAPRVSALTALVPYLDNDLKQQALYIVQEIEDEETYARTLTALIPYLNDDLKYQVLSAARKIVDEDFRASVLSDLVPHFDKQTQIILLQEILHLYNFRVPKKKLLRLWENIEFEGFEKYLIPVMKFVLQDKRRSGMEVVGALTPALVHFSGEEIVPELYRAITDTARWWP